MDYYFSIIMPAFNARKFIKESIESVIHQTYSHWELIVIDDNSIDDTFSIASDFAKVDSRIKVFHNDTNMGVSHSRNRGIKQAQGNFLAFLDSDDIWYPNKLAVQQQLIQSHPGRPIYFSSYEVINDHSLSTSKSFLAPSEVSYSDLLKSNSIGCLTSIINREIVNEPSFSEIGHEDYQLWLSILRNGASAISTADVLAGYRVHAGGLSYNKVKAAHWRWLIYYKYEKLGFLRSAAFFIIYFYTSLKKQWSKVLPIFIALQLSTFV